MGLSFSVTSLDTSFNTENFNSWNDHDYFRQRPIVTFCIVIKEMNDYTAISVSKNQRSVVPSPALWAFLILTDSIRYVSKQTNKEAHSRIQEIHRWIKTVNNKKGWYTDDSKWTYKQEEANVSSKPYQVTNKSSKKKQSLKKQNRTFHCHRAIHIYTCEEIRERVWQGWMCSLALALIHCVNREA